VSRLGVLSQLWRLYDRTYVVLHGLADLDVHGGRYLRVGISRYRGHLIRLPDGAELRRGDRVLVIHFYNESLAALAHRGTSRAATGLALRHILQEGLTMLADLVATDPSLAEVRAVGALTNLWHGCHHLGFATYPIGSRWWARLVGAYQQRLRLNGVSAPRARCGRVPDDRREARLIWMSVATLVRLHAGKARLCGRSTGNPLSSP